MSWYLLPFLFTSKELFCICVVMEVTLTLRMRNIWSFISYWGRARPPSSSCFYRVSAIMDFCPQERNCSVWISPISCLNSSVSPKRNQREICRNQKRWCYSSSLRASRLKFQEEQLFHLDLQKENDWCASSNAVRKNFLLFVGGSGLKLTIQGTKIMASSSISSWQIDGEATETVKDYFLGL